MSNCPRVVSLLPSATEILHLVGAGDTLIGVTHECDYPPGVENLPRLTGASIDQHSMTSAEIDAAIGKRLTDAESIYSLDAKLLEELEPDLVLTQGLCDVCAVSLSVVEQAVAGLPRTPRVLSMPDHAFEPSLDRSSSSTSSSRPALSVQVHQANSSSVASALWLRKSKSERSLPSCVTPRYGSMPICTAVRVGATWSCCVVRAVGVRRLAVGLENLPIIGETHGVTHGDGVHLSEHQPQLFDCP